MESTFDLTNAALAAVQRGWPVFPLRPGTKKPALHGETTCPNTGPCARGHAKWEQRATLDPATVRGWWRQQPGCNVGIATGPAGLLVIDLDAPKSDGDMPCGMTTFKALCERAGQHLPTTRTVRTAGGGWHLYFTAPPGARLGNTAGQLGPLIDTRGSGGYVVAPGSVTPAGMYAAHDLADPAPLPAWMLALLTPAPRLAVTSLRTPPRGQGSGYAEAALTSEYNAVSGAGEGQRNARLTRAARALGRFVADGRLTRGRVEEALKEAGRACGLTERECRATITNALNWSIAHNPGPARSSA
ncbi:bifunctional DNA primase/polymerase [Streptacidiphilus rugosus]|uniref:bifunctional DNA primase/polymerase n=1 Tax=Streptacidiphilus rugosus TaxID=405783 RepID=UPI00056AB82B|nr:bifunctional DNA primase/polymerase [Streptacidiphilus rugosus]